MYVVMWNLPGCLPEMEPATFGTLYEAQDMLEADLYQCMDECAARDGKQSVIDAWQDLVFDVRQIAADTDLPWNATGPDGYVYSITIEYPS